MTHQIFSKCILEEVVQKNIRFYEQLLEKPASENPDKVWRRIQSAYESMNDTQKEALKAIALQAMVDVSSNILGILDGTSILKNFREDFTLTYGQSEATINGDLQDYFLAEVEGKDIGL